VRDESNFLAEYDGLPDELEPLPGLTLGEGRKMLRRPAEDPPGARYISSVAYSSEAGDIGQLALYARSDATERAPIVVFVHGGGWSTGHHFGAFRYLHPLATRGYVAATLTYRLAGEAPWPAAIEDTKCAVRWLRHHAHELGADPDRIVISGDSAGGHLAALTALTPGDYEGNGGWSEVSSSVQGVVLVNPALDLEAMVEGTAGSVAAPHMRDYFGDDVVAASPLRRVTAACPPILTLTGSEDPITTVDDITRFHTALAAAGVSERLEIFDGGSHGFDLLPAHFERCLAMLTEFVEQTVGPASGRVAQSSTAT
jgi:acetyl esterase